MAASNPPLPAEQCNDCPAMREKFLSTTDDVRASKRRKRFKVFEINMSMHRDARRRVCESLKREVASTYNCVTDAMGAVPPTGIILVEGGDEFNLYDTDTTTTTFRQESSFQYLFGVKEPGCFGTVRVSDARATLFIPRLPAEYAVWMGRIRTPADFQKEYGVDEVRFADELLPFLASSGAKKGEKGGVGAATEEKEEDVVAPKSGATSIPDLDIYVLKGENTDSGLKISPPTLSGLPLPPKAKAKAKAKDGSGCDDCDSESGDADAAKTKLEHLATGIRKRFETNSLYFVLAACRTIKSPAEIELMRYVTDVSNDAHMMVLRHAEPGLKEFQLESLFQHYCYYVGGCRHMAYTCICAAGTGDVLHYGHAGEPNKGRLKDGDMCLFDMGAEFHRYASDVTCSFPAGGKFSTEQVRK